MSLWNDILLLSLEIQSLQKHIINWKLAEDVAVKSKHVIDHENDATLGKHHKLGSRDGQKFLSAIRSAPASAQTEVRAGRPKFI